MKGEFEVPYSNEKNRAYSEARDKREALRREKATARVQQQQQSSKAAKQQSSSSGERKRGGGGANKRGKNIEGQLRKPKRDRWSSRPRSRSFWVALAYSMLQRVYSVENARLVQSGRAETKRQSLERAFYLRSESFVSGGMASPPPNSSLAGEIIDSAPSFALALPRSLPIFLSRPATSTYRRGASRRRLPRGRARTGSRA